jgi:hypothetical protein
MASNGERRRGFPAQDIKFSPAQASGIHILNDTTFNGVPEPATASPF